MALLMMEDTHHNWKCLPVEVLREIFQLVDDIRLVLSVCKTWKTPAQAKLYSKVSLKTRLQLINFYITVKCSPHLGEMVRILEYDFGTFFYALDRNAIKETTSEVLSLLTNLLSSCLPNLEEIRYSRYNFHNAPCSYLPVLNALQNSQLKRFKRLESPNGMNLIERDNYTECALLMKHRIEEILITLEEEESIDKSSKSRYLYDNLHQFDKLEDIYISTVVKEIEVLDYIIEACKSLKELAFSFGGSDKEVNLLTTNSRMTINPMTAFTPTYKIKSLYITMYGPMNIRRFLSYITHKFARLDKLAIGIEQDLRLNQQMFTQILDFSSTVNFFDAQNLLMDNHTFSKSMEEYYKTKSAAGADLVRIIHTDELEEEEEETCYFNISRENNTTPFDITCTYLAPNLEWKYKDYLERNGIHIARLHFTYQNSTNCQPPGNFLPHIFTYCSNLQHLYIDRCDLKQFSYSNVDLRKNLSLKELSLTNCVLYPGVLEQLSALLTKIHVLRINRIFCRATETESSEYNSLRDQQHLEIVMLNTQIDVIVFTSHYATKIFYLKVFSLNDKDYYYYRFDKTIDVSNEEEYLTVNNDSHVHICCQTNPLIKFVK